LAEVVEGRALVKENTYLLHTFPTLRGSCVSQVQAGVRHALQRLPFDPRQEPCAVMPLARICAGGGQ